MAVLLQTNFKIELRSLKNQKAYSMPHTVMCDNPIILKTADIGNDLDLVILYMRLERLTPWKEKILHNCVQICKGEMNLETYQRNHHTHFII